MQGRFLPLVDNRIQCFPGEDWYLELELAKSLNFDLIEWTIDCHSMNKNPILDLQQHENIIDELTKHNIGLESVTCDFFMERPPWESVTNHELNKVILSRIGCFAELIGNLKLVIPLVDNGSPPSTEVLFEVVFPMLEPFNGNFLSFIFESDFEPRRLGEILGSLQGTPFGVNLDIGNSAALGWDAQEEVKALSDLIQNVHVKDRIRDGISVRLGGGDADFSTYLSTLKSINYQGNFILQTARSRSEDHYAELSLNLQFLRSALDKAGYK